MARLPGLDVQESCLQDKIGLAMLIKLARRQETTISKTGVPVAMKLQRMLGGLAQVPVLWYDAIDEALIGVVFTLSVIRMSSTHSVRIVKVSSPSV